ncbi:LysR substrate-binding domain-containing protein [Pseudaquabacterium rugosum]|uniref:LysR substrate-binding domain-containing protein n=1 Tax=Pseudaquabacterium rugosum TaxID=2984194 RepID=A0ABU9BC11_9BURK
MKLSQLRDLVAVVEHGGLRAAARQAGAAQPLLTRSIRALEHELGHPLFDRSARGMTLTPAGTAFYRRIQAVMRDLQRAEDALRQAHGEDSGEVVAGLSIMPHVGMLPRALPAFRQRWPAVRLRLIEGLLPALEPGLREGRLDFYLGASPQQAPGGGLVVRERFHNRRTVVARRGHPLAGARRLADLADQDWATTSVDYRADDDLAALFERQGLPAPHVVLQAGSALSLMVALARTDLLAMLPQQWAGFELTAGALVTIPLDDDLPAPDIVLVHRADLPLTPAAEHLVDLMLREAPQG